MRRVRLVLYPNVCDSVPHEPHPGHVAARVGKR